MDKYGDRGGDSGTGAAFDMVVCKVYPARGRALHERLVQQHSTSTTPTAKAKRAAGAVVRPQVLVQLFLVNRSVGDPLWCRMHHATDVCVAFPRDAHGRAPSSEQPHQQFGAASVTPLFPPQLLAPELLRALRRRRRQWRPPLPAQVLADVLAQRRVGGRPVPASWRPRMVARPAALGLGSASDAPLMDAWLGQWRKVEHGTRSSGRRRGWGAPRGMAAAAQQSGASGHTVQHGVGRESGVGLALEKGAALSYFFKKRTDERRWIRRSAGAWCVDERTDARIVSLSFEHLHWRQDFLNEARLQAHRICIFERPVFLHLLDLFG
ncbi:uncharacterized protein [Miscanthus floridulus]|uniref:uncharacterized protein n=1 Tax=Miscanthus floridulus TaxID=154761 RepID=UPI00345B3332